MCLVALRLLVCLHNYFSGRECEEVHAQISQAQEWELARLQTERDSPLAERRDVFTAHDVWVHIKHVTRCSLIASGWRAFSQHRRVRRRRRSWSDTHTQTDTHTHNGSSQTWQTLRWQRKVPNVYVRGSVCEGNNRSASKWNTDWNWNRTVLRP